MKTYSKPKQMYCFILLFNFTCNHQRKRFANMFHANVRRLKFVSDPARFVNGVKKKFYHCSVLQKPQSQRIVISLTMRLTTERKPATQMNTRQRFDWDSPLFPSSLRFLATISANAKPIPYTVL